MALLFSHPHPVHQYALKALFSKCIQSPTSSYKPLPIGTAWCQSSSLAWIALSLYCLYPRLPPFFSPHSIQGESFEKSDQASSLLQTSRASISLSKSQSQGPINFLSLSPITFSWAYSLWQLGFPEADTGDRVGGVDIGY